ncbi:ornithine cyclodeaminase family protein [Kocuria tytonicola]|uniref:Ornithine cyclodeaminase family protein n=1 Tax=Kocuria tytonicola TaxID=2055946 RepID=A0A3L9L9Q0_9MICC|nr:ornithine cyclodeaminase family protein [Kocuria tytonicola]RLY94864.1 ornithine cyclodeaminase family protein [Kocuria tytonicola]
MTQDHSTPENAPRWFAAQQILDAVSPRRARKLLEETLVGGFHPGEDPARGNVTAGQGHMLLMPSVLGAWSGIKVATVSPGNPERGLPRIQATYLLMDTPTLSVQAVMEGNALTTLRTPAVSALAADHLAAPDAQTLMVFGTGPQALSHIEAFADVRDFSEVVVCGRSTEKVAAAVGHAQRLGLAARAGTAEDVRDADVVVCATSAAEPLFDGALVRDAACVVAMGSHEPDARELDAALMGRAQVVVEDRGTALREAGDVVQAVAEGALTEEDLVPLADVVTGAAAVDRSRPRVFKCVGMSWQDLAVAVGVVDGAEA